MANLTPSTTYDTSIRQFKTLEEARANLDTMTLEECNYCNMHHGMIFTMEKGVLVDVQYDEDAIALQSDRQIS